MAKRKRPKARKKNNVPAAPEYAGDRKLPRWYSQQIIKRLERVVSWSYTRPRQVYEDWLRLVNAALIALPDQVIAVAKTGQPAEDGPETARLFAEIRERYKIATPYAASSGERVWREGFVEAFALLLEGTAPGLWAYAGFDSGYMGPDILGDIYTVWGNQGQHKWAAQYFTPWNVSCLAGQILCTDIERLVHDRIKEALSHPDNVLGAAVLLASLAIPNDEPGAHRQWFFNRCLPASLPYVKPILVQEPAVGSGIMILAHAAASPAWAVLHNLIRYYGADIDNTCVLMTRASCMLYMLNGYWLKLQVAAAEANQIRQQPAEESPKPEVKSPNGVLQQAWNDNLPPSQAEPSFSQLFQAEVVEPEA